MTSEAIAKSWKGKFHFIRETKDKHGLRAPQIGALHALLARQDEEGDRSIVVMPTGTGKTETMLSFMIANQCEKLMVVVPFDALRTQTDNKFETLGKLIELGVVDKNIKLPKVKKIDTMPTKEEWGRIIKTNNVIVTTMAMASSITPAVLSELHKEISYLIVDEAHHSEAKTWNDFISGFDSNKIIMFTATPFRDDGKRLKGDVIFNYSLKKAKENHYFSDIDFLPVYAYSTGESDKAIADKAIERLKEDISNGFDHILMARCNNIKRAKEVFEIYSNYPEYVTIQPKACLIYSYLLTLLHTNTKLKEHFMLNIQHVNCHKYLIINIISDDRMAE